MKITASEAGKKLSNLFTFCESVFPTGQEIFIIVTELTLNPIAASFINRYGCKEYFKHNNDLLIHDRQKEIAAEIATLDLK